MVNSSKRRHDDIFCFDAGNRSNDVTTLNILVSGYHHLIYFCAGGAVQSDINGFFTRTFYRFLFHSDKRVRKNQPFLCWNIKRVLPVQSCNGSMFRTSDRDSSAGQGLTVSIPDPTADGYLLALSFLYNNCATRDFVSQVSAFQTFIQNFSNRFVFGSDGDISYISDIFRSIHKDKFRTILQIPERCFQRFSSQVDGDSLIVLCLNHE